MKCWRVLPDVLQRIWYLPGLLSIEDLVIQVEGSIGLCIGSVLGEVDRQMAKELTTACNHFAIVQWPVDIIIRMRGGRP